MALSSRGRIARNARINHNARIKRMAVAAVLALTASAACSDDAGTGASAVADVTDAAGPGDDVAADVAVSDAAVGDSAVSETAATDVAAPWEPQSVAELFSPDRVLDVAITLDAADWDALRGQTRTLVDILAGDCLAAPVDNPFTWFEADVTVNGVARGRVGVRKKGFLGSLSPVKPSLKIKLDEFVPDQRLAGAKRMTLNNAQQDPSYVNQCLTYGLFRAAGLPAPRCNYAHVSVNGAELGVFVHVESIKKPFLAEAFGDDDGDLYEGALSDLRPSWLGTFEKKTNEDVVTGDLQAFADALQVPDDQLLAALAVHVDVDEFVRFWALEVITAHHDGYANNTNNFYLYKDPADDRFHFIVWGADATLEERVDPDVPVDDRPALSVRAAGMLARRLYLHPDGEAKYIAAVRALLDDPWDAAALDAEAVRMRALLEPHLSGEALVRFRLSVDARRAFMATRRDAILAELNAGSPAWDQPLRDDPCWALNGTLDGTVTTHWGSHDMEDPLASSAGTISGTLDEAPLQVNAAGATIGAGTGDQLGTAIFRAIAVVTGNRVLVLQVVLPLELVRVGEVVPVDFRTATGFLMRLPAIPGADIDFLGYVGAGELTFVKATRIPGGAVEVAFDVTLVSPF